MVGRGRSGPRSAPVLLTCDESGEVIHAKGRQSHPREWALGRGPWSATAPSSRFVATMVHPVPGPAGPTARTAGDSTAGERPDNGDPEVWSGSPRLRTELCHATEQPQRDPLHVDAVPTSDDRVRPLARHLSAEERGHPLVRLDAEHQCVGARPSGLVRPEGQMGAAWNWTRISLIRLGMRFPVWMYNGIPAQRQLSARRLSAT